MDLFATRTGTRRNLQLMAAGGWSLLLNPFCDLSPLPEVVLEDGTVYRFKKAFDNGAWTADQQGVPFDVDAFWRGLERVAEGCEWIVAPDIVRGGLASLDLSLSFLPTLLQVGPTVLIPLQDGMTPAHIEPILASHGRKVGLFMGGSTEWKLAEMKAWGVVAGHWGVHYHVGRVNTARRLHLASWSGANSVDGTSASKFAQSIPALTYAARQLDLLA